MFNVEESIQNWRKRLEKHPGLEPGYIEELESHLRDKIDDLVAKGFSEKEAFQHAVENHFDDPEEIAGQFFEARKTKLAPPPWKSKSWVPTMLPNYIKMAIRGYKNQKQFAYINTIGLSIGLACCLLIFLYIFQQLQYDRFHPEADQLFRLTYEVENKDNKDHYAVSVPGLVPTLEKSIPGIEQAARISVRGEHSVEVNNSLFNEQNLFHVDSTFFNLFGFELLQGNPESALAGPNKVVLAKHLADKYFGEFNPVGEILSVRYGEETVDLEVSGIAAEQIDPSHFSFDLLVSFETIQNIRPIVNDQNWWMRSVYSYVKLSDSQDAGVIEGNLLSIVDDNMSEMAQRSGSSYAFHLQPVTDIHLYSNLQQEIKTNGNITYLYLFGSVALLVLCIACFNYMNLATARYSQRAREVGIRKSLGANRWGLIKQFFGESLFFSLIAFLISLFIAWSALPIIEQFIGQEISININSLKWIIPGFLLIWLITGIISGSYPALFLSSFESSQVLKGNFKKGSSGAMLRKSLVVTQFTISVILIISTGMVYKQLQYVKEKPLGYEREQVLIIPNNSFSFEQISPATVQQNFKSHSAVREVAFASHYPTQILSNNSMIRPEGSSDDEQLTITVNDISPEYKSALQLEIVEGRNFSRSVTTDSSAFLINQSAADYFGWQDPLGKTIYSVNNGEEMGQVVGVFRDFHVQSLYEPIEPVLYSYGSANRYNYTLIKFDGNETEPMLQFLEKEWQTMNPGKPFEFSFLDNQYQAQYQSEQRLSQLISIFSILAIAIACLGLFGLAAYTAQRRTKEIGVRKVLGASILSVMTLLSKDFLKLILIAFFIALPISWYLSQSWLQNFAYRTNIGVGVFLIAGIMVTGIAIATISWQSAKVALANPVKSLRSE